MTAGVILTQRCPNMAQLCRIGIEYIGIDGNRPQRGREGLAMTASASGTPDYTMGFSEEFLDILKRCSAAIQAAHLLPHLKPGLRVLDCGCGPGSISVGLADAVAPGEMYGIDMEESQVEIAKSIAAAGGHDNAIFQVADVIDLPFEDNFFDVAHCHNLLTHVPDTQAALKEIMRVLKPGGIISAREMISGSSFTHPDLGAIHKSWDMLQDLLEADEGHPQMGRDLKNQFAQAGFAEPQATAAFESYSTPEEVVFIYGIAKQWFLTPEITEAAIKYGASTQQLCDALAVAYDRWKDHPGAFCAVAYGECIAHKPHP